MRNGLCNWPTYTKIGRVQTVQRWNECMENGKCGYIVLILKYNIKSICEYGKWDLMKVCY